MNMRASWGIWLAVASIAVGARRPAPPPDALAFEVDGATLRATHPSQDLEIAIDAHGVVLAGPQSALSFTLASLDGAAIGPATITHEGARVSLARAGVTEWYVHDARGLEQGFTLASGEGAPRTRSLDVALDGDGWTIASATDARLELTRGDRSIVVDGLYAYDADDRALPVRMAAADGVLRLEVDTADARYPVVIDPTWSEVQRLVSSDGTMGAHLGWSVSVSGDTAVVGAPQQSIPGAVTGAAYVFVLGAGGWVEQAKLVASDPANADRFGNAVAISGDTIVVGAPDDDDGGTSSGSAYVYRRTGTAWAFTQKLHASDASANDAFGGAVSIDLDSIAIGARNNDGVGAVYVFVRGASSWTQQALLTRNPYSLTADFGVSVSISGATVLVGADLTDGPGGVDSGAAYVWTRAGSTWTEQGELPQSAHTGDHFGASVSLSGADAIVGSPNLPGGWSNVGTAIIYRRNGVTWGYAPQSGIFPSPHMDYRVGTTVAISGNVALVAAPGANNLTGVVALITRPSDGGTWTFDTMLSPADGMNIDQFGTALAIAPGPYAFVGRQGTRSPDAGGVTYVYGLLDAVGASCTSGTRCASGICVDGVCCNSTCGGGAADCMACSVAAGGTSDGSCTPLSAARAPTVTCRGATDACDRAETCVAGSALCPSDALAPSSTECRASVSSCDVAEHCSGSSAACPSDAALPEGTACGATPVGACDAQDVCMGTLGATAHCDARFAAAGAVCRTASCTAGVETSAASCSGSAIDCPASTMAACAPFVCGGNACLTQCVSDAECESGHVCIGGSCVVPRVDAGVDAAMPDAGSDIDAHVDVDAFVALDAGARADAGQDAGVPDAAHADATLLVDAGGTPMTRADGCACSVPLSRRATSGGWPALLALLAMIAVRRRRAESRRAAASHYGQNVPDAKQPSPAQQ